MGPEAGFETVAVATLLAGKLVRVDEFTLRGPNGDLAKREVVRHPGSVAVLPFHHGEVIFIRQFRVAAGRALLEIPAGVLDQPGEEPAAAAARECEEEVGYRPGRLTKLGYFLPTVGYSDEQTWLFLGEDLIPTTARPHGLEEQSAEVVPIALDRVWEMVAGGEILDAKTLIALAALERRLADG